LKDIITDYSKVVEELLCLSGICLTFSLARGNLIDSLIPNPLAMKKTFTVAALIMLTAILYCQQNTEVQNEKEAIKAIIEEETNAYHDKDFDRFAATYVQDETIIRIIVNRNGTDIVEGWDNISSIMKEHFMNFPDPSENNDIKSNYKIRIYDDCAWVTFDEERINDESDSIEIGVNILKKVDGKWKIVFLSRIIKNQ
jgi:hypothetical protein